ncbi:unnamed protein product [Linum trigynum]|uniref:Uncharacterized protein n=1 Tax=Linum trigynum TaxID=586398 RepID=A0AAV2FAH4_9ROSI
MASPDQYLRAELFPSVPRKLLQFPAHDVPEYLHLTTHLPAYGLKHLRKLPRHGFRFLLNLLLKLPSSLATLDLEQVLRILELANICQDHETISVLRSNPSITNQIDGCEQ